MRRDESALDSQDH